MCLHVVGLATIYLLPRFVRGEKRATVAAEAKTTGTASADAADCREGGQPEQNATPKSAESVPVCNGQHSHSSHRTKGEVDEQTSDKTAMHSNGIHRQPKINVYDSSNSSDSEQQQQQYERLGHEANLSHLIRKRIDSETRNLEKLVETSLDKTVTGIVDFRDDLMRVSDDERFASTGGDGLRQRNQAEFCGAGDGRREINAAVNQVNVLPAVLSNGHGGD